VFGYCCLIYNRLLDLAFLLVAHTEFKVRLFGPDEMKNPISWGRPTVTELAKMFENPRSSALHNHSAIFYRLSTGSRTAYFLISTTPHLFLILIS
jgi:energy-coupling factor transporter transmembrane protein EcfT